MADTIHFMQIISVKPGTTDAQIQAFVNPRSTSTPPFFAAGPSGGSDVVSPGRFLQVAYNLPAGTYVLLCFVADDMTGMQGDPSSRGIETATFDDVGGRAICANLRPDHATIARCAGRHEAALKGLLATSVAACAREGLVSVDVVAGDGTKVKASASMAANATAAVARTARVAATA